MLISELAIRSGGDVDLVDVLIILILFLLVLAIAKRI